MSHDFALKQIGIIMLGVRELEPAIAFYRGRLGLPLQNQFPGFAFFGAGGVMLVLSEALAQAHGPAGGAVEVVFSVDHVRPAYEALRAQGVEFHQEPRIVNGPMWAANFRDPDGHELSVFGPE